MCNLKAMFFPPPLRSDRVLDIVCLMLRVYPLQPPIHALGGPSTGPQTHPTPGPSGPGPSSMGPTSRGPEAGAPCVPAP
jgi:hypothetical protein